MSEPTKEQIHAAQKVSRLALELNAAIGGAAKVGVQTDADVIDTTEVGTPRKVHVNVNPAIPVR